MLARYATSSTIACSPRRLLGRHLARARHPQRELVAPPEGGEVHDRGNDEENDQAAEPAQHVPDEEQQGGQSREQGSRS